MIARGHDHDGPQLLLLDLGNTQVSLATWADGERAEADHVPTKPTGAVMDVLDAKWDTLSAAKNRSMVVSSVYPQTLKEIRSACATRGIGPLLVVGEDLTPPIGAEVQEPEKVGTDRLCAAAAAYATCKSACVVADFGTALTIDLVADNNVFLGGTILPGIGLSARALHEHTALLPLVEVGAPAETLGKDTVSAIRNGIFAMMTGALREITERYATDIGRWPPLIVTGGDGRKIADACDFVDRFIPDLCLDGLVIAFNNVVNEDDR